MNSKTRHAHHWARAFGVICVTPLALLLSVWGAAPAEAKTPGKTYCFNRVCHRVLSIQEMVTLVGRDQFVEASYYDDCRRDPSNPCGLTSSGEAFRPDEADSAASPIFPDGTILLIRNPGNGSTAVVRVNNAGPYWRKRNLDVSRATAVKLGFAESGTARLEARVMSAPSIIDATYKRNRHYAQVPGPIGKFASLDQAQGGMMMAMALDAMSASVFAPVAGKMLTAMKTMKPQLADALRTDPTLIASADGTLPQTAAMKIETSAAAAEQPKENNVARTRIRKTVAQAHVIRSPAVKAQRIARVQPRARVNAAGYRRQFSGTRSASSRSTNRALLADVSSSTKRSYWISRASRKAAAMSRSGPRANRFATRKLSSIVRSNAVRMAAASGAIRPRLRT